MAAAAVLMAAGAVTGALGKVYQGNAENAAYHAQANSLDYQAQIARENESASYAQGSAAEDQQRYKARMVLGSQAASMAQSGFDPSSGSSLNVAKTSAAQAELDALNIRYGADMRARGFSQTADLDTQAADQARAAGRAARAGGYLGAVGGLLGAGGSYLTGQAGAAAAAGPK